MSGAGGRCFSAGRCSVDPPAQKDLFTWHGEDQHGCYVDAEAPEDDSASFEAKMTRLVTELRTQQTEGSPPDAASTGNLKRPGFGN